MPTYPIGQNATTARDGEVNVANVVKGHVNGSNVSDEAIIVPSGAVDLPTTADATNPASGSTRLVARTDGLYVRDETGTEVGPLGGAVAPLAHAASHQDGGSDELALDGSQITTGTVPAARLGAASSGPLTGRLFSSWMTAPGQTADNITSPFTAAGDLICYPQYMWAGTYVFVGNSYYYNIGTATLRFGLYDSTGTNGGPGALVSDFGTISLVAASGAGAKTISISLTLATSGYYWPSILCDAYTSAPKFVGYTNLGVGPMAFVPGATLGAGDTNGVSAIKRTGVTTGAMPATWGTPTTSAIGAPVIRFYLP